ncbi:protease inhibitor I42 family protein [Candidatus Bipolaricaulota bacterium]|nr:protease inhibitor I42 family protein [Candidatus Bipolaricaulota bacterium]
MTKAMKGRTRGAALLMIELGIMACLALAGVAAVAESAVRTSLPDPDAFDGSGTQVERMWCADEGDYAEWTWPAQRDTGAAIVQAAVNVTAWVSDRILGGTGFDLDVAISLHHLDGSVAEAGTLHLDNPFEPCGEAPPETGTTGYLARGAYVLLDPMLVTEGFRLRAAPHADGGRDDVNSEVDETAGAFAVVNDSAVLACLVSLGDDAEAASPDLAAILADPRAHEGRGVQLDGQYYGAMAELVDGIPPDCIYDGCNCWVFGADGWYIYAVGETPAGLDPEMTEDLGKMVRIEGIVRVQLSRSAHPYAYLDQISVTPGEDAVDLRIVDVDAADGRAVMLSPGETLAIDLPSNPTTGYRWELISLEPAGIVDLVGAESGCYFADDVVSGGIGSGGIQRFVIVGEAAGQALVQLAYKRAWDDTPSNTFTLTVFVAAPAAET